MKRLILVLLLLCILAAAAVGLTYATIPLSNTGRQHFDTIIVLGTPANADGTPSNEQRSRVMEGVREYRAGVAPAMIMTGGPAHNNYVEAHVMAEFAKAQGIPADAIVEEGRAQNTVQNAFYSVQLMKGQGWRSAEVVSSPSHLPRASLIFRHFPIETRMHAAPWPEKYSWAFRALIYWREAMLTSRLRVVGFTPNRFLPALFFQ